MRDHAPHSTSSVPTMRACPCASQRQIRFRHSEVSLKVHRSRYRPGSEFRPCRPARELSSYLLGVEKELWRVKSQGRISAYGTFRGPARRRKRVERGTTY